MKFWWECIYSDKWRSDLRIILRRLPQERSSLKMMKRRLCSMHPTVTPNYEKREGGSSPLPGDPTGKFVEAKEKISEEIREMELHISEVEDAIEGLPERYKELIKYRYFERMGRQDVVEKLNLLSGSAFETLDESCLDILKFSLNQCSLFK